MATLHLVRHGRTVLNEQHRTQGRADSPLTPQGRQGALAVGAYLREVPFVHAYTSPQGRVLETTDLLLAGREDVPRTVLSGLRQDDEAIQQEIFGPVITVQAFDDDDDAIAKANGVQYGLASSVWTRDHFRAERMARELSFGTVWLNTHIPLTGEMPHGGFKQSGYGKDLSLYALEEYTRIKHVMSAHG
mgnify:CR=1 FL=1